MTMTMIMSFCCGVALVAAVIWGIVECIQIENDYKRRKAELDAWYEEELKRINEMYKNADDPHQITWDDYESNEEDGE